MSHDESQAPRSIRTGRVIGARYRLVAPLAEGGMGSVWRAEHETLGHAVAVKFLAGGSAASEEHRARFEREARVAARIAEDCRHVVKVTDHGVEPDGTPWIVMELLHGEGLDKRLRREPRLPLLIALDIVKQVARGLEVAHRHGVIHRDLKPANVFLCSDLGVDELARAGGVEEVHAKLLDFGVAKSLWDDDAPTTEGVVLGTVGYMSPEQLTGEGSIDARTDVWALGAIAYRCVVGRPAFGTGTSSEIAARVTTSNPTPPSEAVASLPPELDDVFARALAREPKDRYASARDFAEALARGASGALITEEGLQSTNDGVVAVRPPKKTRRKAWAAVVLLLALVSLATIVRVWRAPTATSVPHTVAAEPRETFVAPVASPWSSGASPASSTAQPSTNVSATTSASASALPPVPSGKAKALPKVIDTWNKKDEL